MRYKERASKSPRASISIRALAKTCSQQCTYHGLQRPAQENEYEDSVARKYSSNTAACIKFLTNHGPKELLAELMTEIVIEKAIVATERTVDEIEESIPPAPSGPTVKKRKVASAGPYPIALSTATKTKERPIPNRIKSACRNSCRHLRDS